MRYALPNKGAACCAPTRENSTRQQPRSGDRAGGEKAILLRLFRLGWRRSGSLGFGYELSEASGILYGDVRKDLAVERDARGFEAVNQLAIGEAVVAGSGADALDPELAILAFFDAAIALGVTVGAIGGFLRGLVELALSEEKAFCPLEVLLAPCPALGAAFYACHGFLLLGGKQNGLRRREEKYTSRNGFVSRVVLHAVLLAQPQVSCT